MSVSSIRPPIFAQWHVDNPVHTTSLHSPPFKIGKWDWTLVLEKNQKLNIMLVPITCDQGSPIASFNMRLVSLVGGRKTLGHKSIHTDITILASDGSIGAHRAVLAAHSPFAMLFLATYTLRARLVERISEIRIEAENRNLENRNQWRILFDSTVCIMKIDFADNPDYLFLGTNRGPNLVPYGVKGDVTTTSAFGIMLSESIHTDITILASDGSIGAHRAVLAAHSPVFNSIIQYQGFLTHRLDLLKAADNLPRLKVSCIEYLVKFGKIFDIGKEFNAFVQSADRELVSEVVDEIISAWKGV
ncbi:BTB/POZ domain-containing protein-like protein [Tanacetum coccineum]